jgi:hypothetical protein
MATEAQLSSDASRRTPQYMFQAPAEATAFLPGMMAEFSVH